jgi:hypothetical protein
MALFNYSVASGIQNAIYGIGLLTNTVNIDVVGIYDSDSFTQQFIQARPTRARVNESSRMMDYPVETGAILTDHHIINQREIELSLIVPSEFYFSTYAQIRNSFLTAQLLTVQTKASVYPNMVIQAMPHEENPDMYDAITIALRLKEIIFVMPNSIAAPNQPANYSPTLPQYESTQPRGLQLSQLLAIASAIAGYANAVSVWGL